MNLRSLAADLAILFPTRRTRARVSLALIPFELLGYTAAVLTRLFGADRDRCPLCHAHTRNLTVHRDIDHAGDET